MVSKVEKRSGIRIQNQITTKSKPVLPIDRPIITPSFNEIG